MERSAGQGGGIPRILSFPSIPIPTGTLEATSQTSHTGSLPPPFPLPVCPPTSPPLWISVLGTMLGQKGGNECGAGNVSEVGIYLGLDERVCVCGTEQTSALAWAGVERGTPRSEAPGLSPGRRLLSSLSPRRSFLVSWGQGGE